MRRQAMLTTLVVGAIGVWWARMMLLAVAVGVGSIINAYLLGHTLWLDGLPPIAIVNHFAHWLLLVGLVILLMVLLLRGPRWIVAWLLPAVVAFGVWYGPTFVPRPPPMVQGIKLTVASYNVLGAYADADATFAVIAANPVDVLVVQELQPVPNLLIYNNLRAVYPYQVADRDPGFNGNGIGIYSRYPILEVERHVNIEPRTRLKQYPDYVRAVLDVDGQPMVVYGFHAAVPVVRHWYEYDEWFTVFQTELMVETVRQEVLPTLVVCDCNTTPRARPYQLWDSILDDAFMRAGWGFGDTFMNSMAWPWPFGLIRLDYVWHSAHFVPLDARVRTTTGASDHAPLIVTLDLRG